MAEKPTTPPIDEKTPAPPHPAPARRTMEWHGQGTELTYTMEAAMVDLVDDKGVAMGSMFSVAYLVDGEDGSRRPVTFCFNGGPGSASVPLNVGGIGPKRLVPQGTDAPAAPGTVEDNDASPLPATDLVFLDALGTGWSRVAPGYDPKKVWSVDGDADSFARAIAQWLTDHDRWGSPVHLFGESYGTTRNCVLARLLGERGVALSGVVMLSSIFDWTPTLPGTDGYYQGMVPVYAACAQWFGKAGQGVDRDRWFARAKDFVEGPLASALVAGDSLDEGESLAVAEEMAELIGVDAQWIHRRHLRVELEDFRRKLLADEGLTVGRLDMRFTEPALPPVQGSSAFFAGEDPAGDYLDGLWTGAFRALVAETGFEAPGPYFQNAYGTVGEAWGWEHKAPGIDFPVPCPNVAMDLAVAWRRNPTMEVCFMGGAYDAATPWWNTIHDLSTLFLPESLKVRETRHFYGCGHMAYVDEETRQAMGRDLAAHYARCAH